LDSVVILCGTFEFVAVSILCDVDKHGKSKDVGHGDDRRVLDDDSSSLRLDLAVAIRDPDRNPRGIAAVCLTFDTQLIQSSDFQNLRFFRALNETK
jgi:hypothetical protein